MSSLFAAKKYKNYNDYEEKAKSQFSSCLSFLKKHPTLSISLIYLFISCFGLIYIYTLMAQFNIKILPHLEITDFTLAAIHYPKSFIFIGSAIAITWLSVKLEKITRKIKLYDRFNNILVRPFMILNPIFLYSILFLFFTLMINNASSKRTYNDIVENKSQMYTVMLSNQSDVSGQKTQQLDEVQIIADTVKYLWVYLKENEQVHAIPQKNINVLIPTLNKEEPVNLLD